MIRTRSTFAAQSRTGNCIKERKALPVSELWTSMQPIPTRSVSEVSGRTSLTLWVGISARCKFLWTRGSLAVLFVAAFFSNANGQEIDGVKFFKEQVKPLLEKHCWDCHRNDPDDLGGELAIASRDNMLTGGESGTLFDESAPDKSLLLGAISYEDDRFQMPPDGKMSDEEIAVIKKWVELGLSLIHI